jgi:hypothetical protein
MKRLKTKIDLVYPYFLVVLFLVGVTARVLCGNHASKSQPQNAASTSATNRPAEPAIVLVHGAFADASGRSRVARIPRISLDAPAQLNRTALSQGDGLKINFPITIYRLQIHPKPALGERLRQLGQNH